MKNLSLILNAVLIIAVGILYYLHYSTCSQDTDSGTVLGEAAIPDSLHNSSIVYINSDTLLAHYNFYNDMKEEFETKQTSMRNKVNARESALEKEIQEYQMNAQAGKLTMDEARKSEEGLMLKQQKLMAYKEKLMNDLMEEEQKMQKNLYDALEKYFKEFNKVSNYDYILGYQRGGGILFARDSLNITNLVKEGLNKFYEEKDNK